MLSTRRRFCHRRYANVSQPSSKVIGSKTVLSSPDCKKLLGRKPIYFCRIAKSYWVENRFTSAGLQKVIGSKTDLLPPDCKKLAGRYRKLLGRKPIYFRRIAKSWPAVIESYWVENRNVIAGEGCSRAKLDKPERCEATRICIRRVRRRV